jgi:hypothetical protein
MPVIATNIAREYPRAEDIKIVAIVTDDSERKISIIVSWFFTPFASYDEIYTDLQGVQSF